MSDAYMIDKFRRSVLTDAEKERSRILGEIRDEKNNKLSAAEDEILNETYRYIQSETSRTRTTYSRELSKKAMDMRKELLNKRNQVIAEVMNAVRAKLEAFAGSPEYRIYLTNKIRASAQALGVSSFEITVRQQDSSLVKGIADELSLNISVKEESSIKLGGYILRSSASRMLIDETFDQKLEENREYFEKSSGLTLS